MLKRGAILLIAIFTILSCDKETDLLQDKVVISLTINKLWLAANEFNNAGKSCVFPETWQPVDSNTYYLTFESLETGDIQEVVISDGAGNFDFTMYGDKYTLTTSTFNGVVLPDTGGSFFWFKEQEIDLSIDRSIEVNLENPYSAIVVVNKDNTIQPTPTISGQLMLPYSDGWYIYSKVDGVEPVEILKTDGNIVSLNTSYEPAQIYTYMYCEPISIGISKSSTPFTINNNIQI